MSDELDPNFFDFIQKFTEQLQSLSHDAIHIYTREVDELILNENKDPRHIEWLLDRILDFCFNDEVLIIYKKLCRYYFQIDPVATASYVYAYREMWDEDDSRTDI